MTTRLELVWPNKDKFLLVPKDDSGKPVWVERDHPAAHEVRLTDFVTSYGEVNDLDPYSDNLMFCGDSLDVLRILAEVPECARHYRGKVKLVYIDPPFNTGQTFTHYDDWMEHSTWLSFMRDRLLAIKELLSPDGSVWVHLDDAEVHRMRCLMDEVFGPQNFVATVVWEKVASGRNDAKLFSVDQDYVLVFAREVARYQPGRLLHTESADAAYRNPDNDERGDWRPVDYKTGRTREERPNLWYGIVRPVDGAEIYPSVGHTWRYSRERHIENVERNQVWWGRDGLAKFPLFKKFLSDRRQDGTPPRTLWSAADVDSTRRAKSELQALFPDIVAFPTPKSERLLQRVIHIGSNPGDIVLDCFGGSGTTAAVAHKMGRRWVTAEVLPETIESFASPRLQKVLRGEDLGGVTKSTGWGGGGGFRTVSVASSMYETTPVGVMLADWASGSRFARAVAGQLGFEWQAEGAAPFCGVRGRMRLAVFDGAVGLEEAGHVLSALTEKERVTIVAKVVLPGVEEYVAEHSRGSRVKKAPRDLLGSGVRRRRRAEATAP